MNKLNLRKDSLYCYLWLPFGHRPVCQGLVCVGIFLTFQTSVSSFLKWGLKASLCCFCSQPSLRKKKKTCAFKVLGKVEISTQINTSYCKDKKLEPLDCHRKDSGSSGQGRIHRLLGERQELQKKGVIQVYTSSPFEKQMNPSFFIFQIDMKCNLGPRQCCFRLAALGPFINA